MYEGAPREPLWVAFPKAGDCPRRRVASVRAVYARPVKDLAVLVLAEQVPAGVEPAPLRCPAGKDLIGRPWWAFGFPDRDPVGNSAGGQVGEFLSYGWVRLDTRSAYLIQPGFSGGGLWSPDYEAVVGLVGQAHANGDGRAVTLHQIDLDVPDLELAALARWTVAAAGEVALTQWGWRLDRDPEGTRHWRPRGRGVSIDSERGWRFRGRAAALSEIVSWLDRAAADRRVLVVTGSPGVGKSAVLGRIVTTADAGIRMLLPPDDEAVRASAGSVACAVHAKGKTALEVAEEIARAASAPLPGEPGDLAPAIRDLLDQRGGARFNVVVDALDEAAGPDQARIIIEKLVLPLAETCAGAGAQVIVGTRRRDDGGDLLGRFGAALAAIDLDDPGYFAEPDLAAYALACLQLAGDERPGSPYADGTLAGALAARIAALSGQNFLIAGLIARSHGLHDEQAVHLDRLEFTATVDAALAAYLQPLGRIAGLHAADALTALAFAEAPGLPAALWQTAVEALYGTHVSREDLTRFARSSAANFLVETGRDTGPDVRSINSGPVYRLFHQALNDALLHARADIIRAAQDQRALTQAFTQYGRAGAWQGVPDYLLRSLPGHAQAAGLVDDLLTDDTYLLHADLRRLLQVSDGASSVDARRCVRLLRLTPQAITARPLERTALFSVTEALDDLGTTYRANRWEAPYKAQWAAVPPRVERTVLEGHRFVVTAVCAVRVDGQDLLASCGEDTVRIWDPRSGQQYATLRSTFAYWARAVCAVRVDGQDLLAVGCHDGTVRIWDPRTGHQHATLEGHQDWVNAVCAVRVDGQDLLASGGDDGTVRIWDPRTGQQHRALEGHQYYVVTALCAVRVDGQNLLASGGNDGRVRIWDPRTGHQHRALVGRADQAAAYQDWARALCAVRVDGQDLLAVGERDGTVRIWDPRTGDQHRALVGRAYQAAASQNWVTAVCAVRVDGQDLLASGSFNGPVRIWDPRTGYQHATMESPLNSGAHALCAVRVDGQDLLAVGGHGTVRIWDPRTGRHPALAGHQRWVHALCAVRVDGQDLFASGGHGTVRIWDPRTGQQHATFKGHQDDFVGAVCAVQVDGQDLLASSGNHNRTVRIWDPRTGHQHATPIGHQDAAHALCAVRVDGQDLLAVGSGGGTVRIWDPRTGHQHATLEGHQQNVNALCVVRVDGQDLLASGSDDGTVRIWDPRTGHQHATLRSPLNDRVRNWVHALCAVRVDGQDLLAVGYWDGTVRIWDPRTGQQHATLEGHEEHVTAVCAVRVDGQDLLASGSKDRTVRIWDPKTYAGMLTLPTHYTVSAVAWVADSLAVGLEAGVLVIKLGNVA